MRPPASLSGSRPCALWWLGLERGRRARVTAAPQGWGSGMGPELPRKRDVIPGRWAWSESWRVRCPGKGWQFCGVRQAFGTRKRHGWGGGFARFWQDRGASYKFCVETLLKASSAGARGLCFSGPLLS